MIVLALCLACSAPNLASRAPWIPVDALNAQLPESVRVFSLEDKRLRLRAWYVRADLSDPGLSARVVVGDDEDRRESVSSLARQSGACVTINAGYFTRGPVASHDGLVRVEGELIQDSQDRNPALGFSAEGRPDIAWVHGKEGEVVELVHDPIQAGDPVRPPRRSPSSPWPMTELVQGRPALMFNGMPHHHKIEERHPRTAAGIDADGRLILMVVDGRQLASRGATFAELTALMHAVGCVEALNLDGGGSSTFVVAGKLINRPGGRTDEREVMSAISLVCESWP